MKTKKGKSPELFSAAWRADFRRRLRRWYRQRKRDLPWRIDRDPYRVWVSEVMLQQTQVATVERYFVRFLAAFPAIADLARAEEDKVLRLWEGLGYYRRARQLHAAARQIVAQHDGVFPRDAESLRSLPGIGRYTAGAILSIAFDAREPILEANTIRLFARLLKYTGDPTKSAGQSLLWRAATEVLPARDVGELNQALMELGSLICTPRDPDCDACPVATLCPTGAAGLWQKIPAAKSQTKYEAVDEAAVVVRRRGRILLLRRREGERWAGLWDFPRFAIDPRGAASTDEQLIAGVAAQTACRVRPVGPLATLKHGVTRFRITLHCHWAEYVASAGAKPADAPELQWLGVDELATVPLNTTGRKIGELARRSGLVTARR